MADYPHLETLLTAIRALPARTPSPRHLSRVRASRTPDLSSLLEAMAKHSFETIHIGTTSFSDGDIDREVQTMDWEVRTDVVCIATRGGDLAVCDRAGGPGFVSEVRWVLHDEGWEEQEAASSIDAFVQQLVETADLGGWQNDLRKSPK